MNKILNAQCSPIKNDVLSLRKFWLKLVPKYSKCLSLDFVPPKSSRAKSELIFFIWYNKWLW